MINMVLRLIEKTKSRYYTLALFVTINLILSFWLRLVLVSRSWAKIDHGILDIVYIFGVGFVYDLIFNIYFSLFFAIFILAIPVKVFNLRVFKWLTCAFFFVLLYGAFLILAAEWFFWDEFSTRFNFISVDYLVYRHEVTQNMYESYPLITILIGIFVITSAVIYYIKAKLTNIHFAFESFRKRAIITGCILAAAILSYSFIDQSLRTLSDNNYENELASNGPYQFVAAYRNNTLDYKIFYTQGDDETLSSILKRTVYKDTSKGGLYDISRSIKGKLNSARLNVILVSVESLSMKYLTRFGNSKRQDITPYMDEWFKHGYLFTKFYATGTRTIRGLEAITLSVPPTPGRSIVKRPDNGRIYSLGKVFKDNGYDVVFLYGGNGYFDNMNKFFSGNGYRVVDRTDMEDDEITFENAWGVADEDLYRKAIKEADKAYDSGQPFFLHIMTVSNHRPYTYPDGKIDIPSGKGRAGGVKYTDYALKELIMSARERKWFDDTVFVIVADHCSDSAGKVGLPIRKYHIPLFIYAPKYIESKEIAKISSQIDIAPTLLSLLGISYQSWFFGQDILDEKFVERALIGNYQKLALYKDNKMIIMSPKSQINMIDDPYNNEKLVKDIDISDQLVRQIMAYYQGADYVISNKLNRWN
ncbi:MAG: LTA synthase family protein [Candidatus Anammoxibacter sp.]